MSHKSLTPAQAERLEMLAEECSEVIQAVTKILRHGYGSYHPADALRVSNQQLLERELLDVEAVLLEMNLQDGVEPPRDLAAIQATWVKKLRWTHHQERA